MSTIIFEDFTDEAGVLHSKEDQERAYAAEQERQRLIGVMNNLTRELVKRLNNFARVKGYDDIKSLALRAAYQGPYYDEGLYGAQLMDKSWKKFEDIFTAVKIGIRAHPEVYEDIEKEMPTLTWDRS